MNTSRRAFLSVLGGATILAAGGGTWAGTRDPIRARLPWTLAGASETEPRRRALSFAILAPNPHNRQPWVADLSKDGEITLFCQSDRRLPHTDPFDRQITIGLGCFLELLSQAAVQDGWRADIVLFPEGEAQPRLDGRPVANVRFTEDRTVLPDSLFAQVLARRSNKEPYDASRPVETEKLASIAGAARHGGTAAWTAEPKAVGAVRELAWNAMHLEMSTYETAKESIDLVRVGRAQIEASPDGIDLSGPLMEGLALAGLLSKEDMLDTTSSTFQQQLAAFKQPFDTAMAFMWLSTAGNSRADQIKAGRDYVRLNLAATQHGLAMQPLSQALQEFPAMRPHFDAMRALLGIAPGSTLQMLMRMGYGPDVSASPRWPAETRIRSA